MERVAGCKVGAFISSGIVSLMMGTWGGLAEYLPNGIRRGADIRKPGVVKCRDYSW
jgi:hypothetical protein